MNARVSRRFLCVAAAALWCSSQIVSSQGLEGVGALGGLIGSFFARDAYVGSQQFDLFQRTRSQAPVQLEGFSIQPVEGEGWFRGVPGGFERPAADLLQEVWFIKDAHRVSIWAKKDRIRVRPVTAFARLQYYGQPADSRLPDLVERRKRQQLQDAKVEIVTLEASAANVAGAACARYSAAMVDRRVPPEFTEQAFDVVAAGIVCLHPDAPQLAIEVGHSQRRPHGDTAPLDAPGLSTFLGSLRLTPLHRPFVSELRVPHEAATTSGAALAGKSVWLSAKWRVSRLDLELNPIGQYEDRSIFAVAPSAIWLTSRSGGISRVDALSGETTVDRPSICRPFDARIFSMTSEQHGVWMACSSEEAAPGEKKEQGGTLKRLDPETGSIVATIPLAARGLHATHDGLWAVEAVDWGDRCRVHRVDSLANRIVKSIPLAKSWSCELLAVEKDGLWIIRSSNDGDRIIYIDARTGGVQTEIAVPKGLRISGLVSLDDSSLWLSAWVETSDRRYVAAYGTYGGLLQLDRRTHHVGGRLIPTGRVDRAVGRVGDSAWLYDAFTGTVMRVSMP